MSAACDWHRLWPPVGTVKCAEVGVTRFLGYGGGDPVFCEPHAAGVQARLAGQP